MNTVDVLLAGKLVPGADQDRAAAALTKMTDLNIREIAFKINGKVGGRFRVTVSVSTFVPKPFTPFRNRQFVMTTSVLLRLSPAPIP